MTTATGGPTALDVSHLSSGYGEALVIREIELAVGPGEIVALLGKNGMGKSTLLKTIMGFLRVQSGRVRLFGDDITGSPPHRIARRAIAYTPQEKALFQDLTVEENLRLGLRDDSVFDDGIRHIGEFFPFLPQRLKQRAGTLSGGEQKMLLVARALMTTPRLMLVDEITEGLQPSVVDRLAGVLRQERERSGTAMLLIEQNVRFALAVADGYAVLKRGEIVDRGTIEGPATETRVNEQLAI
jgi:ABC-type branched-subunit amino acid transport system ATPase component